MKRIALFAALLALSLTSCASTFYSVKGVTCTAPLADNNQPSCLLPPDLWPVSPGTLRMMHVRWTQSGSVVKEDSVAVGAGSNVSFPVQPVASASPVTVMAWASDMGGAGCPVSVVLSTTATTRPPAAPSLNVNP